LGTPGLDAAVVTIIHKISLQKVSRFHFRAALWNSQNSSRSYYRFKY